MFFDPHRDAPLEQIAYHEAGHACCALWLGWRVQAIVVQRTLGSTGYAGVTHTVGWLVSDDSDPNLGWSETCWRSDDERLIALLSDDVQVLLAGWIAQTVFVAKSNDEQVRIQPHTLLQPFAGALADLIKADDRARLLRGWDLQGRHRYLLTQYNDVSVRMLERWSEVVSLARYIVSAPEDPEGKRNISGTDVHELLGYRTPGDTELDRCPDWPGPS